MFAYSWDFDHLRGGVGGGGVGSVSMSKQTNKRKPSWKTKKETEQQKRKKDTFDYCETVTTLQTEYKSMLSPSRFWDTFKKESPSIGNCQLTEGQELSNFVNVRNTSEDDSNSSVVTIKSRNILGHYQTTSYLSAMIASLEHGTAFPVMHVKHFFCKCIVLLTTKNAHPMIYGQTKQDKCKRPHVGYEGLPNGQYKMRVVKKKKNAFHTTPVYNVVKVPSQAIMNKGYLWPSRTCIAWLTCCQLARTNISSHGKNQPPTLCSRNCIKCVHNCRGHFSFHFISIYLK